MKFTFSPESRPLEGYTIKRAIYRGGFGEVYYALTDAGREVALKLLQNNTEVELRGVQQCLNLNHPNLVTIFDIRTDADHDHWIVMEYVAGENLDAAVRRFPKGMPLEEVRKWLPGIGAGVSFLHSRGLVHRDLKPANIFSEHGCVKIGDVGLSKFITASQHSAQTQSVGTVHYMAPEVAQGQYGKGVDIYALGIILYEMLTGQVPFDGDSTGEILMKHLTARPDLKRLPPRLQPVIGKALEKDPQKRYPSVTALVTAFDQAVLGRSEPLVITDADLVSPPASFETPSGSALPQNLKPAFNHKEALYGLWVTIMCGGGCFDAPMPWGFVFAPMVFLFAFWQFLRIAKEKNRLQNYPRLTGLVTAGEDAAQLVRDVFVHEKAKPIANTPPAPPPLPTPIAPLPVAKRVAPPAPPPELDQNAVLGRVWSTTLFGIFIVWLCGARAPWLYVAVVLFLVAFVEFCRVVYAVATKGLNLFTSSSDSQEKTLNDWPIPETRILVLPRKSLPTVPALVPTGRQQLAEWCLTAPVVVLLTTGLTLALGLLTHAAHPAALGLFGAGIIFSVWGLVALNLAAAVPRFQRMASRRWFAYFGILIGAGVSGVESFLNMKLVPIAENPRAVHFSGALFDYFALDWFQTDQNGQLFPALANGAMQIGVPLFFMGLFLLRNWSKVLSPERPRKVRVLSVLWSAVCASLWAALCSLPYTWGFLWGAAITLIAQAVMKHLTMDNGQRF